MLPPSDMTLYVCLPCIFRVCVCVCVGESVRPNYQSFGCQIGDILVYMSRMDTYLCVFVSIGVKINAVTRETPATVILCTHLGLVSACVRACVRVCV